MERLVNVLGISGTWVFSDMDLFIYENRCLIVEDSMLW